MEGKANERREDVCGPGVHRHRRRPGHRPRARAHARRTGRQGRGERPRRRARRHRDDAGPAQQVVDEIAGFGGEAVANTDDVSDWVGAEKLVRQAIDHFGGLDVVVNNAGILRDRMMFSMTEDEWDAVIKVHLKGTFAPSHFAAVVLARAGEGRPARTTPGSSTPRRCRASTATSASRTTARPRPASPRSRGSRRWSSARYGVTVNAIAPVRSPA